MNSDDINLSAICSKIMDNPDRYQHFRDKLNRFREPHSHEKHNRYDWLNWYIYQSCLMYIEDPKLTLKSLEPKFFSLCKKSPVLDISMIAQGWKRLIDLCENITAVFQEYSEIYPLMTFSKSIRGVQYNLSIDCILRKSNSTKVDILNIYPKYLDGNGMEGLSNTETILMLDYASEIGLDVGKVMEISYSHHFNDKNIKIVSFNVNDMISKYVQSYISNLDWHLSNKKLSISMCRNCALNKICPSRIRLL